MDLVSLSKIEFEEIVFTFPLDENKKCWINKDGVLTEQKEFVIRVLHSDLIPLSCSKDAKFDLIIKEFL